MATSSSTSTSTSTSTSHLYVVASLFKRGEVRLLLMKAQFGGAAIEWYEERHWLGSVFHVKGWEPQVKTLGGAIRRIIGTIV